MGFDRRMTAFPLLALIAWAPACLASEFSGLATLTSDYIYRGLDLSDGKPAAQLGLDYAHDSGLFGGVWGSTIDVYTAGSKRDFELDYYLGYHHEFQAPITTTVTLLRYTYPGQDGAHDYNYNELLVSATWFEHYSLELGYTDDLYGYGVKNSHWAFQIEWPVASAWVIGATLGRNDLSEAGGSRYYYWDVGASARFSRLVVDVRWFDNEDIHGYGASTQANSQFVVSLSFPF
jgi:uncharacterized protein (TIGR02001 family)